MWTKIIAEDGIQVVEELMMIVPTATGAKYLRHQEWSNEVSFDVQTRV